MDNIQFNIYSAYNHHPPLLRLSELKGFFKEGPNGLTTESKHTPWLWVLYVPIAVS